MTILWLSLLPCILYSDGERCKWTGRSAVEVNIGKERFTVVYSGCRSNLKFGNFTLLFGRLRQRIVLKCVPHVQHDSWIFPDSTNQIIAFWCRRCRSPRPCLSSRLSVNKSQIPERCYTGDQRWEAPKGIFTKPPSESRLCDAGKTKSKLCALPSDPRCIKGRIAPSMGKITFHRITLCACFYRIYSLNVTKASFERLRPGAKPICMCTTLYYRFESSKTLLDLSIHNRSYTEANPEYKMASSLDLVRRFIEGKALEKNAN